MQLWTGAYMAVFFIIHLLAIISGRLFLKLDTNIYFGAAGLNSFPAYLFFVPYYFLAIFSFFAHIAAIHNCKMTKNVLTLNVNQQSYLILFVGFLVAVLVLLGLTNFSSGIVIPSQYKM